MFALGPKSGVPPPEPPPLVPPDDPPEEPPEPPPVPLAVPPEPPHDTIANKVATAKLAVRVRKKNPMTLLLDVLRR